MPLSRAYRHPVSWHEEDRDFFCRQEVKEMFASRKIRIRDHHAIFVHVRQFDMEFFDSVGKKSAAQDRPE